MTPSASPSPRPRSRARAASGVSGGFVLLASLLIPAAGATAEPIGGLGPDGNSTIVGGVDRPSGWVGDTVGWFEGNLADSRYFVGQQVYYAAPAVNPMFLDVYASTDHVNSYGQTVEYVVRVRRALNYQPQPTLAPDYFGTTRETFRGSVDLTSLMDNVDSRSLANLKPSGDEWAGLNVAYSGGVLSFDGAFPAGVDTLEFSFAVDYEGRGDADLGISAQATFLDTHYLPVGRNSVAVRVEEPSLEVVKRASTPKVTALGEQVTYTVDVKRPAGSGLVGFEFTDDFSGVADDVEPLKESDVIASGDRTDLRVSVDEGAITYQTRFAADLGVETTQTLSYTVTYAGGGDDVLTNRACALPTWTSINRVAGPVALATGDTPQPVCADVTTLAEVTDGESANAGADAGSTPDDGTDGSAAAGGDSGAGPGAADDADASASANAGDGSATEGNDTASADSASDPASASDADAASGENATADADASGGQTAEEPQSQATPQAVASDETLPEPAQSADANPSGPIDVAGVDKDLPTTGSASTPWLIAGGTALALGAVATSIAATSRRQRRH